jgi:hypothetical protein
MKQTMKKTSYFAIVLFALLPEILFAQDSIQMKTRSFQIGFVTPLGTNGVNSWNVTNKFSINMLAGYAGGVDGAEFSGLVSVLRNDMVGAQFSGLGNVVLNRTRGAQFSGLFNIGTGDIRGAQFAGLLNVSAKRFTGAQISGLINYSNKLRGVQIGVFNFIDSLEQGVPIGFLSFVKNGYSTLEIGATETLYGVVSFKTGARQFYNILSVGGGSHDGLSLFAWGYGFGTFIPIGKKAGIALDGICYQVNEGEWFTNRLNLLNKINLTGSWKVASHLSFFAGLSWNVTVADITDEYGDEVVSHIAPWSVFDETYNGYINIKMYPGFSAGIRL